MKRLLIVLFLILTIVLSSCSIGKKETEDNSNYKNPVLVDEKEIAPSFELKNINGDMVKLSDYHGGYVVINFFATWCPPCKAELPGFIEVMEDYARIDEGITFLFIDVDEKNTEVKDFIKEKNYTTLVPLMDNGGEVFRRYTIRGGIPLTVIVDEDGKLRFRHEGFIDQGALKETIEGVIKNEI